jgi:hypothetical protein
MHATFVDQSAQQCGLSPACLPRAAGTQEPLSQIWNGSSKMTPMPAASCRQSRFCAAAVMTKLELCVLQPQNKGQHGVSNPHNPHAATASICSRLGSARCLCWQDRLAQLLLCSPCLELGLGEEGAQALAALLSYNSHRPHTGTASHSRAHLQNSYSVPLACVPYASPMPMPYPHASPMHVTCRRHHPVKHTFRS